MSKLKTSYECTACGAKASKWAGKCVGCNAWNTLQEIIERPAPINTRYQTLAGSTMSVQRLGSIAAEDTPRIPTGIEEFDRVLGGGLVLGAVVLLGGDPGIGKSTLLLQAMASLAQTQTVLYITGEESAGQVALRAKRLEAPADAVQLLPEIRLEAILDALEMLKPSIVVVDSIQTLYTDQLQSAPGSVGQVRECAAMLTRTAKTKGITIILVGHVTKDGQLAGPRVLEHIVDTVLYFEGDTHSAFRLIRAVKNRFGAANELGVFAMTDKGLKGVSNPSALFLSQAHDPSGKPVAGTCVLVTQEGTRPLAVELQALVDTCYGNPRRLAVGLDNQRLAMLLAVMHRHAGIALHDQDVFVNVVGGVRVEETASDLAVALAIQSSFKNRALPKGLFTFGEIGLAGEVRPAPRGQERLKEAAKLGFSHAIIPFANMPKQAIEGLSIIGVRRIEEAIDKIRHIE
ncbi:MAG: repair protein RadA [Pseudomonadota bacterium]|jgi:DNA repair protein RadA/Sms